MSLLLPTIGAAAGLGLGAGAAELVSRAWLANHGRYYVWPPNWRAEIHPDPIGLPWLPPVAHWSINSVGERGPEPPDDWSDTARVLVAGGSTTECYFIDQPSTWSEVLSEHLNAPGAPQCFGAAHVHVGNIGRSVVDAEYLTTVFKKLLPNYDRLDLVVLFMGNSEAVRWMHLREADQYPDEPAPIGRLFAQHPEGPFGWGPGTLASRRLLAAAKRRFSSKPDVLARAGKRLAELRARRTNAAHWIDEMPNPAPLLAHYDRNLRELLKLLRTKVKRVLFVAQPFLDKTLDADEHRRIWNFGYGRPYHEVLDTYYRYDVVREMLYAVRERGLAVAAEEGAEVYDMVSDVPSDWDHYYDSLHHTPLGNAVVAERIAGHVLGVQRASD